MICSDCGNMDIRYNEDDKGYHCNNCGSRNLGKRKEKCIHMMDYMVKIRLLHHQESAKLLVVIMKVVLDYKLC